LQTTVKELEVEIIAQFINCRTINLVKLVDSSPAAK